MSAELEKNIKDLEGTIHMIVNHIKLKALSDDHYFSKCTKALTIQHMCNDVNLHQAQLIQHLETLKIKTNANN